jgi:long-subunit fatty acid transport protein
MLLIVAGGLSANAQSTGALGSGLTAAAIARGGTMVAEQGDPLEAVEGNPAGLAALGKRTVDVSGIALFAFGNFANSVDSNGSIRSFAGAVPYAAFGSPLGASNWKAAVAFTPDMLMRAAWRYGDPPGTAGVSYGVQKNESEIVALRSSATIARTVGSKWAFGGGIGLVYNTNTLHAPYIFQQQPQLAGLKVLVDLNTRGFGWNGNAGGQWQPSQRLRLGLAWKSVTYVQSHGDINGSASALFTTLGIAADPSFHYLAEVDNKLPQTAVAGLRWQANRRAILSFEGGWTGWAGSFESLPVKLKDGSNATINSVAGSSTLRDEVALYWRDQGSFHAGIEVPVKKQWTGRAGYSYASNPVPSATLTPLTAAILTNSLSAGAGYNPETSGTHAPWLPSGWRWDVAYQAQLPATQSVGHSALLAGEYDNSRVHVLTQSVTVSARFNF